MCLDSITSTKSEKLPKNQYRVGWKLLDLDKKHGLFCSLFTPVGRQLDKWVKCRVPLRSKITILNYSELEKRYSPGFHIFTTRESVKIWSKSFYGNVVKVYYRRVVARGLQSGCECVIAKEMFVPSENNTPPNMKEYKQ